MKIKLSKSQWQQIGKMAGWIKKANGWGRFSGDLCDCIEGQVLLALRSNGNEETVFNAVKQDSGLAAMMLEEQMTDEELRECITENMALYRHLDSNPRR